MAESLLQTALTQGHIKPDLNAALNDKVNKLAHFVEEAIVLIVAVLMALKPF